MYIHPDAISFFKNEVKINDWIKEQVPKYQGLKINPVPNTRKRYVPNIYYDTLEILHEIPGRTPSRKINNLYWDMIMREEKKQRRIEIMMKLFPKHSYNTYDIY